MKKVLLIALAVLMVATMLGGCGGTPSSSTPGGSTGKSGNVERDLVYCWTSKIGSLDPLQALNTTQIQLAGLVMERLCGYDENTGERWYGVAKSHEETNDHLTWTFKLHDNIYFHDGQKLTSADVKYSLEKAMVSEYQGQFVDFIESVEAPDELTVVLNLKHHCSTGFAMLHKIFILPSKYYEEVGSEGFSDHPIGSGPYKFVSHDIASGQIVVERSNDYWGEKPVFPKVTFRTITDVGTALIALEKGEVDITLITANEYTAAAANPNLEIGQSKNNILSHLIFNTAVEPTNNKLFRQACGYALDYEALYLIATGGHYGKASTVFYLDMWGEMPTGVTEYRYDPDKARELLAQSGLTLPIDLGTIQISPANKPTLEAIQQYLADVDIHFEMEQVEGGAYIGDLLAGTFNLSSMMGNDVGITAATGLDSMLNSANVPGFNLSRWQDPATDEMLARLVYAKDDESYKAAQKEVVAFIQDEAMYITFAHRSSLYAYTKDLNVYLNSDLDIKKFSWK